MSEWTGPTHLVENLQWHLHYPRELAYIPVVGRLLYRPLLLWNVSGSVDNWAGSGGNAFSQSVATLSSSWMHSVWRENRH